MGIVIGNLREGNAPCVEGPTSPKIRMGEIYYGGAWNGLTPVRRIRVERDFFMLKKNIGQAYAHLLSLAKLPIEYNTGVHGRAKFSGDFREADPQIDFDSVSPSISSANAVYGGNILDALYLLPAGVSIEYPTDKTMVVKAFGATVLEYETPDKGDETGFTMRNDGVFSALQMVKADRAWAGRTAITSEPIYHGVITDDDWERVNGHIVPLETYHEVGLYLNGYKLSSTRVYTGASSFYTAKAFPIYKRYPADTPIEVPLDDYVFDPRSTGVDLSDFALFFKGTTRYHDEQVASPRAQLLNATGRVQDSGWFWESWNNATQQVQTVRVAVTTYRPEAVPSVAPIIEFLPFLGEAANAEDDFFTLEPDFVEEDGTQWAQAGVVYLAPLWARQIFPGMSPSHIIEDYIWSDDWLDQPLRLGKRDLRTYWEESDNRIALMVEGVPIWEWTR